MQSSELIALGALIVAFISMLLAAAKGNREAHGETAAQTEARVKRDTNLERDARETKEMVARIESSLTASTHDLGRRIDKVHGKLDAVSDNLSKLSARVDVLEHRQDRSEDKVDDLMSAMREEAAQAIREIGEHHD